MRKANTKISIVIPVYNEAKEIAACLQAIAKQTVFPFEVLIVDNNSTDETVQIAKQFTFVTLLQESKQGQRFAQITGFNAAKGDIIVRIDADTRMSTTHIETVLRHFEDVRIDAITGYGVSRSELVKNTSKPWCWFYFAYTHAYFGHPTLWGANMAFRRSLWPQIAPLLITNERLHEDQDISLALISVGATIKACSDLVVSVQMEDIQKLEQFTQYLSMMRRLKYADDWHERADLPTRLPKTSLYKRSALWLASSWSIYFYYSVLFAIDKFATTKQALTTRLSLADRFQDL